ncbi:MAG: hypothetical protein WAV45_01980 [Propionibacteriaceae bacterium]|nr:hypothetical protein [Micropruina sp.]HBX79825.1 hypothetical protein [Propionibacteriaceae bacterium]
MKRSVAVGVLLSGVALLGVGCSGGPTPSPASPGGIPTHVANVPEDRKSVSLTECAAASGGWRAAGTVKNPGSASRTYTVTVFFTSKAATVLASASTTATVDPGKEAEWSVNATFAAPEGTRCVLRGVAAG